MEKATIIFKMITRAMDMEIVTKNEKKEWYKMIWRKVLSDISFFLFAVEFPPAKMQLFMAYFMGT